jgi:nucleoside-diphosphate-sugar epimerase
VAYGVEGLHVVLGAGPLGLATAEALALAGVQLKLAHRSGTAQVRGATTVAANLDDPAAVAGVVAGARVVYMCAQPPYHRWPEVFPGLMARVMDATAAAGATLVMGDNLYMYGEVDGPLHERLPYAARTRKGLVRARIAQDLMDADAQGRLRAAIVRGSDFFGPRARASTMGERVFEPMLSGRTARGVGDLDQPHSYTFICDFGAAMAEVGISPASWGQVWHAPNAPAVSTRRFLEIAFQAAGLPPKIGSIGPLAMRLAGLFVAGARESVEMMYQFRRPFVVNDAKWRAHMALNETPLEQAIATTVRWYREQMIARG